MPVILPQGEKFFSVVGCRGIRICQEMFASMGKRYTTVLSIAGSDPVGGAGVQADIKTCCALGVYAMTAITAVTAQNTKGVVTFDAVRPELIEAQLLALSDDVTIDAVKIGMLPDVGSIEIVADWLDKVKIKHVVVDPVLVATSGHNLTSVSTVEALRRLLFPKASLITPNLPESLALTDGKPDAVTDLLKCASTVLLKGGHEEGVRELTDILYQKNRSPLEFKHEIIATANTHGTGCSLSTAIACFLALDYKLEDAVEKAIEWLQKAIMEGSDVKTGHGHGPINHNFNNYHLKQTDET